jgi:hypothetical protein
MFIRILSDAHLEMGNYEIPKLPTDSETVLILAGDIGMLEKPYTYKDFIDEACDSFKHVIWTYGNHEYYRGNWPYSTDVAEELFIDYPNLSHGFQFTVFIDDVVFVCDTLWTDYNKLDPLAMWQCQLRMNDHRLIRTGPPAEPWRNKFLPHDAAEYHYKARDYIFKYVKKYSEDGKKIVVVTHHAPSQQSIHERYKFDETNAAYASDLDMLIEQTDIKYWFHGHVHDSFNYMINNTNVIANPVGYFTERNPEHNPTILLEV